MKLNRTSQYAIRIMEFIAKDTTILCNAKMISDELDIPYKYLTKIMTLLIAADFIKSIRGREGGYLMIKEASEIKILDILEAVKESINAKNCLLGIGLCNSTKKCSLHDIWEKPKQEITDMFRGTTLHELL
jgi:Rrf2 family protein